MCINFEESHKLVNEVTVDFSLVFFKKNVTSFYTPHAPYNVLSTFSTHTLNNDRIHMPIGFKINFVLWISETTIVFT